MPHLLQALVGIAALGGPVTLMLLILPFVERRDGQTRFVIVGGRTRRRSTLERNKPGWHARS